MESYVTQGRRWRSILTPCGASAGGSLVELKPDLGASIGASNPNPKDLDARDDKKHWFY